MQLDSATVAGFHYLSSCVGADQSKKAYDFIGSKIRFFPSDFKQWFDWYLDYYKNYDKFPTWEQFQEASSLESDCSLSKSEAFDTFTKQVAVWETDSYAEQLVKLPIMERRELLSKMALALEGEAVSDDFASMHSSKEFELSGSIILTEKQERSKFKFPVQRLNSVSVINPGNAITVIAPPACMKSAFALNTLYLNCHQSSMRGLYIYLENTEQAYQSELLARHSYTNGMNIENVTLKRGVLEEDKAAVAQVNELFDDYTRSMQGEIFFMPFSRFQSEPLRFGTQLGRIVDGFQLDFVAFDYVQRAVSFAPAKWQRMDYINEIMSTFTSAALGAFSKRKFIALSLAQPNRAAEERWLKTKGTGMTLFDAASMSSLERDSFFCVGLYADAESKAANTLSYKVLKNRDEASDVSVSQTVTIPQYCYLGDELESDSDSMYSMDSLLGAFGLDL